MHTLEESLFHIKPRTGLETVKTDVWERQERWEDARTLQNNPYQSLKIEGPQPRRKLWWSDLIVTPQERKKERFTYFNNGSSLPRYVSHTSNHRRTQSSRLVRNISEETNKNLDREIEIAHWGTETTAAFQQNASWRKSCATNISCLNILLT